MANCFDMLASNTTGDVSIFVDEKMYAHQTQIIASVQQILIHFLNEMKDVERERN
jgi:hypothetical protein